MGTCPPPLSSAMSAHSSVTGTPQHIRDWLMSLPPASPASPSASPASNSAPTTTATCGPKPSQPSAWYDPATACWRTFQGSLLADILAPFSATFPKAGMTHVGKFYPLPKWERRIDVIASGLWQTITVNDAMKAGSANQWKRYIEEGRTTGARLRNQIMWTTPSATDGQRGGTLTENMSGTSLAQQVNTPEMWPTMTVADATGGRTSKGSKRPNEHGLAKMVKTWPTPKASASGPDYARMNLDGSGGDDLATAVAKEMLPTPNARDWRSGKGRQENGHTPQLPEVIGGQLNPTWVEWLMGWPLGWTDLKPLGMDRFQQWLEQHGFCSHKEIDE